MSVICQPRYRCDLCDNHIDQWADSWLAFGMYDYGIEVPCGNPEDADRHICSRCIMVLDKAIGRIKSKGKS